MPGWPPVERSHFFGQVPIFAENSKETGNNMDYVMGVVSLKPYCTSPEMAEHKKSLNISTSTG